MFCTNCGNPVDEGAAFCTKCGAKTNATVESSDANSAPQCPASDSKRSLVSKMKALLIAGSTEATDEDVEAVLDAQDPDRHLPFKARTKEKWNRVCDKTRRLLADFGIGPDASSEGPAPAYGLWRNTLTWFVAFMTLFLLIGIVIIWIVEPMGMEPPPLGKGGKSVAAAFVYLLVRRIRKPIGNLLFPVAAVEKANAEGDWSAAHAASKKLRRRLIVGTCIFGVLVLLSLRGGSRDNDGHDADDPEFPAVESQPRAGTDSGTARFCREVSPVMREAITEFMTYKGMISYTDRASDAADAFRGMARAMGQLADGAKGIRRRGCNSTVLKAFDRWIETTKTAEKELSKIERDIRKRGGMTGDPAELTRLLADWMNQAGAFKTAVETAGGRLDLSDSDSK